jgi:DNA mismatch endonuclease Vsr
MPKKPSTALNEGRRRNMQANRNKDTSPEMLVRRRLHRDGFRYRLHRRDLPGKPDITLPACNAVVEIRGCFWHGHGCKLGQLPVRRTDYWTPKIKATHQRDAANAQALADQGWELLEIWECELRADPEGVLSALVDRLREIRSHK